jgi:hypothetical protein
MTNLIEKSLLLGFGIFTLTIFSSLIIPFLGTIADFNQNGRNDLETYMFIINEIDQGINYVVQNQDEVYLKEIDYPSNLNTSFYMNIAKYEFFIEGQHCVKINEYNETFFNSYFHQIHPGTYLLIISRYLSLIKVNISNLH